MSKHRIDNKREVGWGEVKPGDKVYIAGILVNGKPTCTFGPHYVRNPEKEILENSKGRTFFERWGTLYVEDG